MSGNEKVPIGVIVLLSVITVLAFTGNALVCLVVAITPRLRNVTSLLIVNLAISDILYSAISLPLKMVSMADVEHWMLGNVGCKIVMSSPLFCIASGIYTMVAISHERRVSILGGLNSKVTVKQAKITILVIWLLSVIVSVPQIYEYSAYEKIALNDDDSHSSEGNSTESTNNTLWSNLTESDAGGTAGEETDDDQPLILGGGSSEEIILPENYTDYYLVTACGSHGIPELFEEVYSVCIFVVGYLIPLLIISVNYLLIVRYIWQKSREATSQGRTSAVSKRKVKIVKMLIIVVVVFAVCWAPFFALFVREEVLGLDNNADSGSTLHSIKLTFSALSTVANPILYAVFNKNFRDGLKKAFFCCQMLNSNRVDAFDVDTNTNTPPTKKEAIASTGT